MYYGNQPYFSRENNEFQQDLIVKEEVEGIYGALIRETTALYGYGYLYDHAPNELERNQLSQVIQEKGHRVQQLINTYASLTGFAPMYQPEPLQINSYNEGLTVLQRYEQDTDEYYRYYNTQAQYPFTQEMYTRFLQAGEVEDDARFAKNSADSLEDHGPGPYVVNIEKMTKKNKDFRLALWTGKHLQLTLMSIPVGGDIGVEVHPHLDQFLRIEQGSGVVQMGDTVDKFDFEKKVSDDDIIIIPAGKWHNLINTGKCPIKLYSIYAPPQHPFGTVHETQEIALASEEGEA